MDILRAHIAEALGPRQSSQYRHVPDSEGARRFGITWLDNICSKAYHDVACHWLAGDCNSNMSIRTYFMIDEIMCKPSLRAFIPLRTRAITVFLCFLFLFFSFW